MLMLVLSQPVPRAIRLAPSANIAAGAVTPTTAQLAPPTGKTSGNFQSAFISDDTNPLPAIDPGNNVYLEPELAVQLDATDAEPGASYEIRWTNNGVPFDTYPVLTKIIVAAAGGQAVPVKQFAYRLRRVA